MKNFILKIVRSPFFIAVIIFVCFAYLRWIPEKNIGQYPIGYDTVTSYPQYIQSPISLVESLTADSFDFFKGLFIWSYHIFQSASVWVLIKGWGVLLYGALVVSFFLYLVYGQKIKSNQAVLIVLIFGLSLSILRVSMELFRNELGLIFLFVSLTFWENITPQINFSNVLKLLFFLLFCFLVYKSHQLVFILLGMILFSKGLAKIFSFSIFSVQALTALIVLGGLSLSPLIFEPLVLYKLSVWVFYGVSDVTNSTPFAVTPDMVASLYLFMYKILSVFAVFGLWRAIKQKLNYQVFLLLFILFISISPLLFSGYGFYVWDRWMYFVILPLSFFAYSGIEVIATRLYQWLQISCSTTFAICLVIILWQPIAFVYSGRDAKIANFRLPEDTLTNYFPPVMAGNSLHNFNDTVNDDFVKIFNVLNKERALVVLDHSLAGFLKTGGMDAPMMESYYGQLLPNDKINLKSRNFKFYSIGLDYKLVDYTKKITIGNIDVYRFDAIK